jgi:hypothetical protein
MTTKCYAPVRGRVIRVTRTDACGNPDPGSAAVVVSKRVSSVAVSEVNESGTNIRERNFADELCVVDDSITQIIGYGADITLCGVDPDLISIFTGQPTVLNAAGDVVGFDANTGIDLDGFGFALEVWSRLAGSACDIDGNREWGYTVFPFLKGGRLGNFSFENGPVTFTITGAQTRDGNGWGVGPYDVDRDEVGALSPLNSALSTTTAWRSIIVTADPPEASCGAFALASA